MYLFPLLQTLMSRLVMSGNVEVEYESGKLTQPATQVSNHDFSSSSTPAGDGWQIVSASVRGTAHERNDASNQDKFSWWQPAGDMTFAVLCVADGHGGSEYTRSDTGARLAVEQAQMLLVNEVLPRIKDGSAHEDLVQFKKQLEHQLPKDLPNRWRDSVNQHAADHPITENRSSDVSEQNSKENQETEPEIFPEQRYGATILAALLTPDLHIYIQLGDGDILTLSAEGEVTRPPFDKDSHLLANHTTSLCSKEAWRFVRIHFQPIVSKPPVLVMLATDGYVNSFAEDAAFKQVAIDFCDAIHHDGPTHVASQLIGWLKETSRAGSGDDISVVVATLKDPLEQRKGAAP